MSQLGTPRGTGNAGEFLTEGQGPAPKPWAPQNSIIYRPSTCFAKYQARDSYKHPPSRFREMAVVATEKRKSQQEESATGSTENAGTWDQNDCTPVLGTRGTESS